MRDRLLGSTMIPLLAACMGCAITHSASGGRWQRADDSNRRVGSAFLSAKMVADEQGPPETVEAEATTLKFVSEPSLDEPSLEEPSQQEPILDDATVVVSDLRDDRLSAPAEPVSPGVEAPAAQNDNASIADDDDLWLIKSMEDIRVDIRPTATDLPPDRSARLFDSAAAVSPRPQEWPERECQWAPTEFWHRPLYFEDVLLERYGQMRHPCLQPILSGVHFFGNIPILPYKMGIDRPYDLVPTLGYYRPGSPTPPVGRWLPMEADASLFEAGTWVGLILLLP